MDLDRKCSSMSSKITFQFSTEAAEVIKALVEMHSGSIDVQSKLDVGATITIRFPAEHIGAAPQVAAVREN